MEAATARLRRRGRARASASRSSATTTSTALRARRCSANICRPAAARRSSTSPIASSRATARTSRRWPPSPRAARASSSPSIAARSATSRSPRRARLGLDVVVFDHHQAPERCPTRSPIVDPNRQDDLSGLGHLCAAGVVYMGLVALNRALRDGGFFNGRSRARSARRARSRRAGDRRRRRAAGRPQPRLRRARAGGDAPARARRASPRCSTSPAPTGRRAPIISAFSIGPRINAGGRIGDAALGARLLTTRDDDRGARDRRRARPAQPRAPADRDRDARRGRGGGARCARARGARRVRRRGGRGLAAGRRRPGRGAAEGAVRAARLRAGARTAPRRPARRARSPASISAASCAPRSRRASRSRAAATRWRRASRSRATRLGDLRAFLEETLGDAGRGGARARRPRRSTPRSTAAAATPALVAVDRSGGAVRRRQSRADVRAAAPSPGRSLSRSAPIICGCARSPATAQAIEAIAFRAVGKPLGEALRARAGAPSSISPARWRSTATAAARRRSCRVIDAAEVAD